MRRRLLACALLASLTITGVARADGGAHIALQPGAQFPDRRFVVTLPPGAHSYDVRVTENGVPVVPHLRSLNGASVPVSLAVLLDTSDSMQGKPIAAALDAARTLVENKSSRSEVAVYGFSAQPYVVSQWSTVPAAIEAGLPSVQTTRGTALWDAVTYASQELRTRPGSSKAIVVLTDGADISSSATPASATAVAKAAHVHVYAVGLPGVASEASSVQALVDATGGDFIRVSSLGDLRKVYAGLAASLNQQYLLTYTSQLRGVGKTVTVRMDVDGASAAQRYTIPPMAPVSTSRHTTWWSGNGSLALIAVGVGLVVLFGAFLALRPVPVSARRRLLGYGRSASSGPVVPEVTPQRLKPTDRRSRWWVQFVSDVERGNIPVPANRLVAFSIAGGVVVCGLIGVRVGYPVVALLGVPAGMAGAWFYVRRKAAAWHATFNSNLADSLLVLASSLRAGHSLLQAVAHVAEEADEASAREWEEVVRRTRLGVAVEDALDEMVVRVGNRDLQWIALVARVQHQVGGNMAEMFDIVADTVRQRQRLREMLHSLTAQGRMTRWILTLAPFGIGLILFLQSPTYIVAFLHDPVGQVLILGAVVMSVIGSIWLKRIVEIEV